MGYMRHHAILVTGGEWSDAVYKAHIEAENLGCAVTPVIPSRQNDYLSFAVVPDGSKEGWRESERGDEQRAGLVEWMDAQRYDDGSSPLQWCEVQYGDDDSDDKLLCGSYEYRLNELAD